MHSPFWGVDLPCRRNLRQPYLPEFVAFNQMRKAAPRRFLSVSFDSQLPSAQNNLYAKVAYFGGGVFWSPSQLRGDSFQRPPQDEAAAQSRRARFPSKAPCPHWVLTCPEHPSSSCHSPPPWLPAPFGWMWRKSGVRGRNSDHCQRNHSFYFYCCFVPNQPGK